MATRAQKTQVGLFLIFSTVAIIVAFVVMSGYRAEPVTPYSMEFDESILGLSVGSPVVYRGVPVGRVTDITVSKKYLAHVNIEVKQLKVQSLREGVTAQLTLYSLAAGTMCVSLDGGNPNGPILPPGSMIETKSSLTNEISSQMGEVLDGVRDILNKIRDGMKGMHDGDIKKVMDHADELVQETRDFLATATDTIDSVRGDAEKGVAGFRQLTEDLQHLSKDTDDLVVTMKDKIQPLKLSETETSVRTLVDNVNELAEKLQSTVNLLDKVSTSLVNDTDNVQHNLRNSLNQMTDTMQSLNDVLEQLKENPSSVVWGKGKPKGEK